MRSKTIIPMTETQRRLAGENTGLAYSIARKWERDPIFRHDFEELLSIAMQGLCRAAVKFDESRGFKFSTFACTCIHKLLIRHKRILQKPKRDRRREAFSMDAAEVLRVSDPDAMFAAESAPELREAIGMLTARQQRVLASSFFEGLTYEEIAAQMGVSKQRIGQIVLDAIKQLRMILVRREDSIGIAA